MTSRRSIVNSASYLKMKRFIWLYELGTYYDKSWANNDQWFLTRIAEDAREYSGLKLITNVPEVLATHLSYVGGLYIYIKHGVYVEEGYGEEVSKIPKIESCDPESYMYLYAGYRQTISNSDIRSDNGFYETAAQILGQNRDLTDEEIKKKEMIIEEGSGRKKPEWWDEFYKQIVRSKT